MQATHRVAALVSRSPAFVALRSKASSSGRPLSIDTPSTTLQVCFQPVRNIHHTNLLLKSKRSHTQPQKQTPVPVKPNNLKVQQAPPASNGKGRQTLAAVAKATAPPKATSKPSPKAPLTATAKGQKVPSPQKAANQQLAQSIEPSVSPTSEAQVTTSRTTTTTSTDVDASKATKTWTEKAKDLWATAKYLFKFYFNGVKQIWANRTLVKAVQQRVAEGGELQSRDEFQLLRTHRSDMKKLPLFLLILLVLEEALPLVVIWAPSLLPSTCVLPSQLLKIRMSTEVKRAEACQKLRESKSVQSLLPVVDTSKAAPKLSTTHQGDAATDVLSTLSQEELSWLAKMFSLATWGGTSMVRRRLDTHLAYLREDDKWIAATMPVGVDVLAKACSERGLRSADIDPKEMTKTLRDWAQYTTVMRATRSLSDSSMAMLSVQMYKAGSLQNVKTSLEAEKQRGLLAKTKDVLKEVVEEEKKVLSKEEAAKRTSSSP